MYSFVQVVPFTSQVVEKGGKIPARTDWIVLHAHIDNRLTVCVQVQLLMQVKMAAHCSVTHLDLCCIAMHVPIRVIFIGYERLLDR